MQPNLPVDAYDDFTEAPQKLYLNFGGTNAFDWFVGKRDFLGAREYTRVHGVGSDNTPIHPFSLDGDYGNISPTEQTTINAIAKYAAEKYLPFNMEEKRLFLPQTSRGTKRRKSLSVEEIMNGTRKAAAG